MTKISTVYAALISSLDTLYSGKQRLHNPYNLEKNVELVMKDAWGLKAENANPETLEFCDLSIARQFTLVLVRQFVSLQGKEDGFDSVTTGLLEDQQAAMALLFSPNELGVPSDIEKIDIVSVSGVQELTAGEKKYLFSEVAFTILISELIS